MNFKQGLPIFASNKCILPVLDCCLDKGLLNEVSNKTFVVDTSPFKREEKKYFKSLFTLTRFLLPHLGSLLQKTHDIYLYLIYIYNERVQLHKESFYFKLIKVKKLPTTKNFSFISL